MITKNLCFGVDSNNHFLCPRGYGKIQELVVVPRVAVLPWIRLCTCSFPVSLHLSLSPLLKDPVVPRWSGYIMTLMLQ